MSGLPVAQAVRPAGTWGEDASDRCHLTYEDRFFRRKKLTGEGGTSFIADFSSTTHLDNGDAVELSDGRLVEIVASHESLLAITGSNLAKLAWHVGNRHTPCQVETARLLIQNDPVIRHMLEHLGAKIEEIREPFIPEGGAYGHGRTHSHEHGHTAHDH